MNVERTDLPNGVRVISARMPSVQSASIGLWAGVGGRHEPAAACGISHFIEHMLFKGTASRSARQISMAVEGVGGHLNAFTQEECTCYYAQVPFDHAWRAFAVLADMYLNAEFNGQELDRERGVIIEEIMMYRDEPPHHVQDLLTEALWRGHPLGRPISGSPETVRRISRADMLKYRERCYTGRNTVAAFAGRVEHKACVAAVERWLSELPPGKRASFRPAAAGMPQDDVRIVGRDVEQSHAAIGVRIFGRNDPRRFPLSVLNTILGGNMSSRLFQRLRERHGFAYSVHSSVQLLADSGALVIEAGLDRKRAAKALTMAVAELSRLVRSEPGRAELKRAKDFIIGQIRLGLESTSRQMLWIGENLVSRDRFVPPAELVEKIEAVDARAVREVARDIFTRNRISLAIVGPESAAPDEGAARRVLDSIG